MVHEGADRDRLVCEIRAPTCSIIRFADASMPCMQTLELPAVSLSSRRAGGLFKGSCQTTTCRGVQKSDICMQFMTLTRPTRDYKTLSALAMCTLCTVL